MSTELRRALEQVAQRFRHARLWTGLTLCWLVWALAGVCLWLIGSRSGEKLISDGWLLALLGVVVATGLGCALAALRSVRDSRWVARRIEARHPELGTGLLAAVEEDAATPSGRLGFLQSAVIRKALDHRRTNDWDETVPTWRLRISQLAHAATLGFLIAVAIALASQARSQAEPRTAILAEANAGRRPGRSRQYGNRTWHAVARGRPFQGGRSRRGQPGRRRPGQKDDAPRHDPQPGRPHVRRPRRVGRRRPVVSRRISRKDHGSFSCSCV